MKDWSEKFFLKRIKKISQKLVAQTLKVTARLERL